MEIFPIIILSELGVALRCECGFNTWIGLKLPSRQLSVSLAALFVLVGVVVKFKVEK